MARVVGDRLIVNVARKPGEEQLIDLMQLFNQNPNRIIVVAGTVGADGAPNTCPITLIYAKDEKTLLVATLRTSATTANLRRDGCEGSKISRCLTELTPEEVLERVRDWFGEEGPGTLS